MLLKLRKVCQQRGGFVGGKKPPKSPTNEDHISIMKVYPFMNIFKGFKNVFIILVLNELTGISIVSFPA